MSRRRGPSLPILSALAVIGGLALIAVSIAFSAVSQGPALEATTARAPSGVPSDGLVLGRADAPVTIDLYEDFQCPACQRWGMTVFPTLAGNELASGRARIVFHDYAFLGPESFDAARAGYAALQQGHFWDMWATIYANHGQENSGALARDKLLAMANALGLDVDRFRADMDSADATSALDASNAHARDAGVASTPTIVVGGRLMVGAGYPEIAAAIVAATPR